MFKAEMAAIPFCLASLRVALFSRALDTTAPFRLFQGLGPLEVANLQEQLSEVAQKEEAQRKVLKIWCQCHKHISVEISNIMIHTCKLI